MLPLLVEKYIKQEKGMVADTKAMPRDYFIKIFEPTKKYKADESNYSLVYNFHS